MKPLMLNSNFCMLQMFIAVFELCVLKLLISCPKDYKKPEIFSQRCRRLASEEIAGFQVVSSVEKVARIPVILIAGIQFINIGDKSESRKGKILVDSLKITDLEIWKFISL